MSTIKIIISHFLVMVASVLVWMGGWLSVLGFWGLDRVDFQDLLTPINLTILFSVGLSFIGILLVANLASYVFIAKFLKVPRSALENVIAGAASVDRGEAHPQIQRFYLWCLDIAYRKNNM